MATSDHQSAWRTVTADEVRVADTVRTPSGEVLTVSHIETAFLGRASMLAFVEDTAERWYKRPVAADAVVEIIVGARQGLP